MASRQTSSSEWSPSRKTNVSVALTLAAAALLLPFFSYAQVSFSEIMYDLDGSDAKREWVELYNAGASDVDLSDWRFNDGSNHVLNEPPENGGSGSFTIPAGGYTILAADAAQFVLEHSVSVSVIDTVMSLGQQEGQTYTLTLVDAAGAVAASASYTTAIGANGDGNSLQLIGSAWQAGAPTPGSANSASGGVSAGGESAAPSSSSSNTPPTFLIEPSFVVEAGTDRVVTVGADEWFEGRALGRKGESLEGERFLWNFGDGTLIEGDRVAHHYRYPGRYVVVFTVGRERSAVSDRFIATALPADIVVREAASEYIELENRSLRELDLSGWHLRSATRTFTLPEGTVVLPKTRTRFPSSVTGLIGVGSGDVALLYPNGVEVVASSAPADAPAPIMTQTSPSPIPRAATPVVVPMVEQSAAPVALREEGVPLVASAADSRGDARLYVLGLLAFLAVGVAAFLFRPRESEADTFTIIET